MQYCYFSSLAKSVEKNKCRTSAYHNHYSQLFSHIEPTEGQLHKYQNVNTAPEIKTKNGSLFYINSSKQKEQPVLNHKINRENGQELVKKAGNNDSEDGSVDSRSCHRDIESDEVLCWRGPDTTLRVGNGAMRLPGGGVAPTPGVASPPRSTTTGRINVKVKYCHCVCLFMLLAYYYHK